MLKSKAHSLKRQNQTQIRQVLELINQEAKITMINMLKALKEKVDHM